MSKRDDFLAWFDEWKKQPDEFGPEWWDEFDRESRGSTSRSVLRCQA